MNRYMNTFVWIIIIIGLGLIGYFAYSRLSNDFVYENEGEVPVLVYNEETGTSGTTPTEEVVVPTTDTPAVTPVEEVAPTTGALPAEYAVLGGKIEKFISQYGGTMKVGSKGTRVGTVQEFLNIYNKTKDPIDNVYGAGTATKIKAFQTAEKLAGPDGQAGPATFTAMLAWLKK